MIFYGLHNTVVQCMVVILYYTVFHKCFLAHVIYNVRMLFFSGLLKRKYNEKYKTLTALYVDTLLNHVKFVCSFFFYFLKFVVSV